MKEGRKQFTWKGEKNRTLQLMGPCSCGCEDGYGVGYLSGSDAAGDGFTVWIEEEAVYVALLRALNAMRSTERARGRGRWLVCNRGHHDDKA